MRGLSVYRKPLGARPDRRSIECGSLLIRALVWHRAEERATTILLSTIEVVHGPPQPSEQTRLQAKVLYSTSCNDLQLASSGISMLGSAV